MAKTTKSAKTKIKIGDSDDAEETKVKRIVPNSEEASEETTEESETEASEEVETEQSPEVMEAPVTAKKRKSGWVTVACVKEVDPAPTVGHFKFSEYKIHKLEINKPYEVPRHVAEHLIDKKVVVLVG